MGNSRKTKTNKVCGMCGNIGYAIDIATCSRCKKASEHIYCMQNQLFEVPEIWYCEECLGSAQVVNDRKVQDTHTKQMLVEGTFNLEKNNSRDKRSLPLNARVSPDQINSVGKQLTGSPKPLGSQDRSCKVPDVGKEERVSIEGSPSGKHLMQPLSRNTSLKAVETGKVKFIPAEEAALLTSGVRVSDARRSLGAASCQTDWANIKSPPILRSKSTSVSILASSKAPKILSQPNKESADADVSLSPTIHVMTKEHVTDDKQRKIQKDKASGKEVSAVLSNEKKSIEGSVGDEARRSSSKHMTPAGAECDFNAPPLHINDEHRKATTKSPKHESIAKPSKDHTCKEQPLKAHIPDKELRVLQNETNLSVSTAGGSGTVFCSDAQLEEYGLQEMDLQLMRLINPEKLPKRRALEACWKGTLEVSDVVSHVYDGIRAHFPPQVSHKSYEISKRMPGKLKLEIVDRRYAWPQIFKLDPPTKDDIGLYFFPCEHERLKEYICLMEQIDSHDFAMKSCVGDAELLIFSSKQLPVDCQLTGVAALSYLWGIFRHVKWRKPSQHAAQEQFPSCSPVALMRSDNCGELNVSFEGNTEEVDMEVDMIGGTEIGLIDRPIPRFDAPPGFAKPISEDSDGIKKFSVKFPLKKVVESILPNVPIGFYKPPSSKHGSSFLKAAQKVPAIPKKEIRGFVSSSGGDYETTGSESHELQSKRHQADVHHHKSAKHHRSSPRTPSSEKYQGLLPPGFGSSELDFPHHNSAKHHRSSPRIPSPEKNQEFYPPGFGSSEVDVHHHNSAKHHRSSPHTPYEKLDDHHHNSAKHYRSSPRTPSSENNQGLHPPGFGSSELDVHHHNSAKYHRSSPHTSSSEKNQEFHSFQRPNSSDEREVPHTGTKRHAMSMNPPSLSAKEKWISIEEIQRKKIELQRKLDTRNEPPLTEDRSRTDEVPESRITVSAEWATKEEHEGKVKTDRQSECNPMTQQPSSVSACCGNPSISPELPLLSADSTVLPLFPEEAETIQDADLKKNYESDTTRSFPSVSHDLTLSRPRYVKNRDSWISTISKERLEQDGCVEELYLKL